MPDLHRSLRLACAIAFALTAASCAETTSAPPAPAAPAAPPRAGGVSPAPRADLPLAPGKAAVDRYFGRAVTDPYRNFEDWNDPAVAAWMKAQSDYARTTLAGLPGRAELLAGIERYDGSVADRVTAVARVPGGGRDRAERWFFERRGAQDNQFKLYTRDGLKGRDRLLVDPEAIEKQTGKPHAINWFAPSGDGALVAYGLSQQGSEEAVLHLANARTGAAVGAPITRANFGAVDWSRDGRSLVFNRLQELKPGMPETAKYQNSRVWLLRAGEPVERARAVLGAGLFGVEMTPTEFPVVELSEDGRWALGYAVNGVQREVSLWVSPQAALLAGKPVWTKLFDASAQITGVAYHADALYLVGHAGAPRSKVLALDLKRPDLATAREVVAASDRVVVSAVAASDALYVETRDGNVKRLYAQPWAAKAPMREVALPVAGSFQLRDDEGSGRAADPRLPGVVIALQGWTRAAQVMQVAADGTVSNTGLQPAGPFDAPDDIEATEVKVRAADGAMVPMSIVHKKGLRLDGRNPTILYGYASYGITEEPFYSSTVRTWLDAGGVYAIANPRGSSVYGEDWYRAGWQTTKPNTWNDFIACAEWLVAQRYTEPAKLGIFGGSAGGILVGRAMTARPDLFAAVVDAVGANDMLRAEFTPNGVTNVPEFGSVATEAGFRSLLEMSMYEHVVPNTRYPAVLFTAGVNDPRVEVWMSTKASARMQAATTSGRPILLRLDYDAGHGVGSTKKQRFEERADIYAFFLWQMGVAGYQP